ncbi:hypothetical protein JCM18899A_14350 [Nocardioides sp. AN3]
MPFYSHPTSGPALGRFTGRRWLLAVGGLATCATMVVGLYGILHSPADQRSESTQATPVQVLASPPIPQSTPSSTPALTPQAFEDRALPHTTDPVVYARAVGASLFDWETSTGLLPADYSAAVLADADPSGEETAGLITDVTTYLPTLEQWLNLAAMDVTQSLDITHAAVPASWSTALARAHGNLRPGTTAITITGTRRRTGTWHGALAHTSSPVAFTVFLACPPAFDRCHLLRLSQVDHPLR